MTEFGKFIVYCAAEYLKSRTEADYGKIFHTEEDESSIKRISEDNVKGATKEIIVETPEELFERLQNFYNKHYPADESSSSNSKE